MILETILILVKKETLEAFHLKLRLFRDLHQNRDRVSKKRPTNIPVRAQLEIVALLILGLSIVAFIEHLLYYSCLPKTRFNSLK